MLVTVGVGFVPASDVAALSPGLLPLFAASISYIFFGERLSIIRVFGLALIACGAVALVLFSIGALPESVWKGDLLFVCAGFMGSIYTVRMRRSGLSATEGAALIGVYSMLFYLPTYAVHWQPSNKRFEASPSELLFQGFYQGPRRERCHCFR